MNLLIEKIDKNTKDLIEKIDENTNAKLPACNLKRYTPLAN